MTKKQKGKSVPPLRNEHVTGMTDGKQEAAIQASGRDPRRDDAAREFLDEQREQADETERSGPTQPQADGDSRDEHAGIRRRGSAATATQLEEHWDPGRRR